MPMFIYLVYNLQLFNNNILFIVQCGGTILHWAVYKANRDAVWWLSKTHFLDNVDVQCAKGRTPLYEAVCHYLLRRDDDLPSKWMEIITILLNAGANPLARDKV